MTLSFVDNSQYRQDMHPQLPPPDMHLPAHHMSATSAHSAPANIVFNTNPPVRLPSPGEMDFDLSPLTSPWIEAYKPDPPRQGSSNKRTASPNDDEQARYTRQRPSPAILPTQGSKRSTRGTKSASSTPLMRSTRSGSRKNGTAGDAPADTPSPVDLSMPPPAPPMSQDFNASSSTASNSATPTQSMTPVTPASIMNLGRLGINSNLAPPSQLQKADGKGKGTSRRESNAGSKKHIGTSLVSPSLKPILPAGNVLGPNALASSSMPSPLLRKTSHKAAEQKRRDSLKTTFDDLRMLLPPIPLPSEDGFPDEPILPGAMPPRGPPRGNVEGPNRGISKLQLLRCGNDYIRLLKGKIERRDSEMSTLRREIVRLRSLIGEDVWREGAEDIDLDRDMDLGEVGPWRRSASAYDGDEGDEDGGE
ncbi:hypothetical protein BV25DRAFT_1882485 [Artomyces pyxidatus]|uniref:Uncharacterized protein n=1 Tax=Artomyces pyxidatus TaxID=48021 RepID=A0ACB8T8D9_9AGAM|nr:hypothetical protein BV25DRAFT_1882485 [Artomyces pyxidatus]